MVIDLMEKVHWTENPLNYIVNVKGTLNIRFGNIKPRWLPLGKYTLELQCELNKII